MKIQNIASLGGTLSGCDCDEILQRLTALEEGQCDCATIEQRLTVVEDSLCDCAAIADSLISLDQRVTNVENDIININSDITLIDQHITQIQNEITVSAVRSANSPTPQFTGLGASVISIGPTYNYWGSGIKVGGSGNMSQAINYYLVTPAQFPELAWYQGATTISTVWIQSGGVTSSYPLFINQTGIWFTPPNTMTIANNATFNFTQTLILMPLLAP